MQYSLKMLAFLLLANSLVWSCTKARKETAQEDGQTVNVVQSDSTTQIELQGCSSTGIDVVAANALQTMTITVANSSSLPVSNIQLQSEIDTGFFGGTYPGSGGTCGATIESGADCTLVLAHNSFKPMRVREAAFVISYEIDGQSYQSQCQFNYDALGIIGQDEFSDEFNLVTGSLAISDVHYDGTHLIISEADSHRVLIWNSIPTTPMQAPDVILGNAARTDIIYSAPNPPTAASLNGPQGVFSDGTRLFVADTNNNRVLIWTTFPTEDGQDADVVIGQDNFTSKTANKGAAVGAGGLWLPHDVAYHDSANATERALFVADTYNNRVLIWTAVPGTNGANASFVLGQANTSTNGFACTNDGMHQPMKLAVSDSKLAIADFRNNRVGLYHIADWTTWLGPAVNGQAVDYFAGDGAGCADNGLSNSLLYRPTGVHIAGNNLFIADTLNARVVRQDISSATLASGTGAALGNFDNVLGQADFTSNHKFWNGSTVSAAADKPNSQNFTRPIGVAGSANLLWVADSTASRVMEFNATAIADGMTAGRALRQKDPSFAVAFARNTNGVSLAKPEGIYAGAEGLYVADSLNNRVLVWSSANSTAEQPSFALGHGSIYESSASFGQTSLYSNGPVNANNMFFPSDLRLHNLGGGVYRFTVSDYKNQRILVWNSAPQTNTPPDFVIGQANFTVRDTTTCDAVTLQAPGMSQTIGGRLYVSDYGHNRVLVWNSWPSSDGTAADFALGQNNLTTCTANRGGSVGANTFNGPWGMASDGTNLIVGDWSNNRIMVWNTAPSADTAPNYVIGQPDMTSNTLGSAGNQNAHSFNSPWGLVVYNGRLYVTDFGYHRALVFNLPITANEPSAVAVIGQPDFTASYSGVLTPGGLVAPSGISIYEDVIYITDRRMRVIGYPVPSFDP